MIVKSSKSFLNSSKIRYTMMIDKRLIYIFFIKAKKLGGSILENDKITIGYLQYIRGFKVLLYIK